MKLLPLYLIAVLFIGSCDSKVAYNEELSTPEEVIDSIPKVEEGLKKVDLPIDCSHLSEWHGGIQGTEAGSDSTCCFYMAECHEGHMFDVVWVPNELSNIKNGTITDSKRITEMQGNKAEQHMFVFEIEKRENLNPTDEFERFEYVFPSEVKVYVQKGEDWFFCEKKIVASFEEFGELKLTSIYKYH